MNAKIFYYEIIYFIKHMINGYINFFFVFFLCFKALFTEEEMTIRIKQVIDNTSFAIIFNEEGENYSIITPFHLFQLFNKFKIRFKYRIKQ